MTTKCERCKGEGVFWLSLMVGAIHEQCPACNGTGEQPAKRKLDTDEQGNLKWGEGK